MEPLCSCFEIILHHPHKDHLSHKDPNEEKDDKSSLVIIPEDDSEDEEALDKELIRAEPNHDVYKPLGALSSFIEPTQCLDERKRGYIA